MRLQLEQPRLACATPALQLSAAEQETLRSFYQQQDFALVWNRHGRLEQLLEQLEQLADDGLNPASYQLDNLHGIGRKRAADPAQAACNDILASHVYLQALQHLSWGRLERSSVEPLWHSPNTSAPARPVEAPSFAAEGLDNLAATFERARPQLKAYRDLRRAWAELRRQPLPNWPRIPAGPLLRPGKSDSRVLLLEQRLASEGYLSEAAVTARASVADIDLYDPLLVDAVETFQREHLLQPDGVVGPATLAELNISPAARRDQVRVNLERLRWQARELEPRMVVVDVAGAGIVYYRNQEPVWQARTQVGRPERTTPLLKSRISHLTLNPTWTVPPTILREDKLPEIQRDIGFLEKNRLRVLDYSGNPLDPYQVDWSNPRGILLRQDAGPTNPLGQVAIRFPNPFSVYLHDTPSQHLFDKLPRVFSSGCVRVEQVMQLLDHLLADASPAERQRIDDILASGRTRDVGLPRPVPILLGYWTTEVDAAGRLRFRPDMYQLDARLLAALDSARL
ncbi:MAG TPA: L,D-transpeptidase family protein [Pseudomonas sp.]